jgi:hypothetical protein
MTYLVTTKADLYNSTIIDFPDVEASVIYTGKKRLFWHSRGPKQLVAL